jgi:hypothetical protein
MSRLRSFSLLSSLGAALLVHAACEPEGVVPDDTAETDDSGDASDTTSEDTSDSVNPDIPNGNLGSIFLANYLDEPGQDLPVTELIGVFADDLDGLVNAARCVKHSHCATETPALPGAEVDHDTTLRFDATGKTLYRVANPLRVGSHSAGIATGPIPYNYSSAPTGWQPGEALGIKIDVGDWGAYNGSADITLPPVIRPTSPSPASPVAAVSNEKLRFTWESGGEGDVYLDVFSGSFWRTVWLADTGSYELDLSTIPFDPTATTAKVHLSRQSEGTARINGNEIDLVARSTQRYTINLTNISSRTKLTPAEDCADATSSGTTPAGSYYGRINGTTGNLNPGATGCTEAAAPGAEGLVKVVVPPSNQLTATYNVLDGKPVAYLLTDCADASDGSCLVGDADTYASSTSPITLTWLNDGPSDRVLYLALDAVDANGLFTLDLAVREVNVLTPYETCEEALAAAPVASGSYVGSLASFQNSLSMPSTCTNYATAGRDGFVKVSLRAGETLDATYLTIGRDTSFYLLGDCAGTASVCLDGADATYSGQTESLSYTATTDRDVILGLDCFSSDNTDFTLELDLR